MHSDIANAERWFDLSKMKRNYMICAIVEFFCRSHLLLINVGFLVSEEEFRPEFTSQLKEFLGTVYGTLTAKSIRGCQLNGKSIYFSQYSQQEIIIYWGLSSVGSIGINLC
jgi:hypothetical protein